MKQPGWFHREKTHCKWGHAFTPENTYHKPGKKLGRVCRTCRGSYQQVWDDKDLERKHKRRWAWKKQGIVEFSTDRYEQMHKDQDGRCAICRCEIRLYGKNRADGDACVDHDKASGLVRGLLCRRCNLGLGFLGDRAECLASATAYLEKEYGGATSGCM